MANEHTSDESYVVWQGSHGHARGMRNIWDYLDQFDDHKPGRLHYEGRPHLLVSVPAYEPEKQLDLEPGSPADIAFCRSGVDCLRIEAHSEEGLSILRDLGWQELDSESVKLGADELPEEGLEQMWKLQEEGRLVTLPAPMDPPSIQYSMSHQEFYVLEAMIIGNDLCTHCNLCQAVCPPRALEEVQEDGRIRMTGDCVFGACGLCYLSCPQMYWQLWMERNPDDPIADSALAYFHNNGGLAESLAELKAHLSQRYTELHWEEFEIDKMEKGYLSGLVKQARKSRQANDKLAAKARAV